MDNQDGSSPRVRGIRLRLTRPDIERRFIPAGAGNTSRILTWQAGQSVHPRGCGEYFPVG